MILCSWKLHTITQSILMTFSVWLYTDFLLVLPFYGYLSHTKSHVYAHIHTCVHTHTILQLDTELHEVLKALICSRLALFLPVVLNSSATGGEGQFPVLAFSLLVLHMLTYLCAIDFQRFFFFFNHSESTN